MILPEENKKYIINSILENIACIADKEYHVRVWINAIGPECDSFSETVNQFFEACEPTLREYKEFEINEKQYKILKIFYEEFDNFLSLPIAFDPVDFIDTPEWEKIVQRANEVLMAFNFDKRDTN